MMTFTDLTSVPSDPLVPVTDQLRHAATRRLRRLAATAGVQVTRAPAHAAPYVRTTMLDAAVDLRDVQIAARHTGPRTRVAEAGRSVLSAIATTFRPSIGETPDPGLSASAPEPVQRLDFAVLLSAALPEEAHVTTSPAGEGSEIMGGPEPDEQGTDLMGGARPGTDEMGGPEPDEQGTDLMGGS